MNLINSINRWRTKGKRLLNSIIENRVLLSWRSTSISKNKRLQCWWWREVGQSRAASSSSRRFILLSNIELFYFRKFRDYQRFEEKTVIFRVMKQARCNKDLFWAPSDGEIICKGIIQSFFFLSRDFFFYLLPVIFPVDYPKM